jgi:hypothetical protein
VVQKFGMKIKSSYITVISFFIAAILIYFDPFGFFDYFNIDNTSYRGSLSALFGAFIAYLVHKILRKKQDDYD